MSNTKAKGRILYGNGTPVEGASVKVFANYPTTGWPNGVTNHHDVIGDLTTNAIGWFDQTLNLPQGIVFAVISIDVTKGTQPTRTFNPLPAASLEPQLNT